jgi:hypothetical protein
MQWRAPALCCQRRAVLAAAVVLGTPLSRGFGLVCLLLPGSSHLVQRVALEALSLLYVHCCLLRLRRLARGHGRQGSGCISGGIPVAAAGWAQPAAPPSHMCCRAWQQGAAGQPGHWPATIRHARTPCTAPGECARPASPLLHLLLPLICLLGILLSVPRAARGVVHTSGGCLPHGGRSCCSGGAGAAGRPERGAQSGAQRAAARAARGVRGSGKQCASCCRCW